MTKFPNQLKIASISAEVDPYSKTGGLADVARSLPKALKRQGHDVVVITPFYSEIIDPEKYHLKKIAEDVTIIIDNSNKVKVNFWRGYLMEDLPIYFIENEQYFSRRKDLYGSSHENARFLIFCLAALKLLIKIRFEANIIQCHDWHTGLIPYFLKRDFQTSSILKNAVSVLTIHNLTFQFGHNWWEIPPEKRDSGRNGLPNFNELEVENINFAKRGIINADIINAVSEQYAEEILTKDFGQDLHRLLKNREDRVFGIVNGIDYKDYNPHNDPGLYRNYDWHNFKVKEKNKLHLQKKYGLEQNVKIPLICMTSRVAEQKGFDLVREIADILFQFNVQLIVLGDGDVKIITEFKELQKKYSKKFVHLFFKCEGNSNLITKLRKKHEKYFGDLTNSFFEPAFLQETSIFAASDFILIPSRFEPCGLTQMKSMRYGCVPIARYVGGYVDTVYDYNPRNHTGNGFVFRKYDSRAMLIAISRAIETFKRKDEKNYLTEKVMRQSFSWEYPARKYVQLFYKALEFKDKNGKK